MSFATVEGEFHRLGIRYKKGADWHPRAVMDRHFVTEQNQVCSDGAAKMLPTLLD